MLLNWRSIAVSSLLLIAAAATCETRPHYGGTLRVELRAQPRAIDPLDEAASVVSPLVFDTLVTIDSSGHLQQALAVAWTQESDRRCRFTLQRGVKFSDGTPLTATVVAASLRNANPDWNIREIGDVVIVETDQATPNLAEQLALVRNAIAIKDGDKVLGTGAFVVANAQGTHVTLQARDDAWRPRPFVDRVDIQFGRSLRDQSFDLDSGRADVIEVGAEEGARSSRRIVRSDPSILYALRFSHTNAAARDSRIREALSLAIDRDAIANIILQRRGDPSAGLLPNWLSGYSFLFGTQPRIARARQLKAEAGAASPLTLVYRAADPVARLIAERIALNAADAGLAVRTSPDTQNIAVPDIELLTVPVPSLDPATALAVITRPGVLALPYSPPASDSPDDLFHATVNALKDCWAVPIAYAPAAFALSPRVQNWTMSRTGDWQLENVSVTSERAEVRP